MFVEKQRNQFYGLLSFPHILLDFLLARLFLPGPRRLGVPPDLDIPFRAELLAFAEIFQHIFFLGLTLLFIAQGNFLLFLQA